MSEPMHARQLCEPILLDDRQVADEALCRLHDLVVDDPACRRLTRKEDRRWVDVEDLARIGPWSALTS